MKNRTLISALVVTLGISTSSVNAAPSSIDTILSQLVSTAVSITTEEIKNEVTESVMNAAYHVQITPTNTSVEITDLNPAEEKKD